MAIDLAKLSEPFPAEDIEWRVSRAGRGSKGIYCFCLAYITARAIAQRLDEVCGPENWRNEEPRMLEFQAGKHAFAVGISIKQATGSLAEPSYSWVTKWDVSEPTNIEAAKGGFSGAMKRAGAQWGIGRYLYHLEESFAEVSEERIAGWNYATLPARYDNAPYYWKPPELPGWALPKEPEYAITQKQLTALKVAWRDKYAPDEKNPATLAEGFGRFVTNVVGEFPHSDFKTWTLDALERCSARIESTTEADGVDSDVPFEAE